MDQFIIGGRRLGMGASADGVVFTVDGRQVEGVEADRARAAIRDELQRQITFQAAVKPASAVPPAATPKPVEPAGFAVRAAARPVSAVAVSRGGMWPTLGGVVDIGAREILSARSMLDKRTLQPRSQSDYLEAAIMADRVLADASPAYRAGAEAVDEKQAKAFAVCARVILASRGVTEPTQAELADALVEAGYDGVSVAA